jgi:hypothetical protein
VTERAVFETMNKPFYDPEMQWIFSAFASHSQRGVLSVLGGAIY